MAKQVILLGTTPGDGTGTPLDTGGDMINDNFTELYADKHTAETAASIINLGVDELEYSLVNAFKI
jgi:hypothetical protein